MSAPKSLIINCGSTHVSAAVFDQRGSGLVLEDFASVELDYDPSHEAEWLGAVTAAIGNLTSRGKFRGPGTLIAPGYLLLTKIIKVPHVDASRRAQIIAYEAQNNIPYPLNEVVWDHQVIADDGVEAEVVLIALKSDQAENFCNRVANAGINPQSIQAASLLDYNAFRYNGEADDTLLINIGARSSNLMFVNDQGFHVRNINLGGNTLTQNIADNLGSPFVQAENVKTAFFSGETSYSDDDAAGKTLRNNAETFLKRLNQEVTRSIVDYRRRKGAKPPSRILLTGRGSLLPGLPEFLIEKQKVEVEFFNPLANVEIGGSCNEEAANECIYQLSEVVGAAVQPSLGEDAVGANLLPPVFEQQRRFRKQKPFLVLAAAAAAVAPIPLWLYLSEAATVYEEKVAPLEARASTLQSTTVQLNDLKAEAEVLAVSIDNLKGLAETKYNWIEFLSDLQSKLREADDVWLDRLEVKRVAEERPRRTPQVLAQPSDGPVELSSTPQAPQEAIELSMAGRLLIRGFSGDDALLPMSDKVAERIQDLLDSFEASPYVVDIDDFKFDENPRLVTFEFTLKVNPQKPL
ncbi:MAG: pilus assembly protein PilM [Opitutales bacterium]